MNFIKLGGFILKDLVDEIIQLDMDDIENYDFPLNKLLGIKTNYSGIKFEFIAHFTDNPNLLCFGSGLSSRSETTSKGKLIKPPYFRRWSWYKYFDENFIAYADPMFYLDEEIGLGWYVGDKDTWYLEIISLIIKKIAKNRKIATNNILCYGSSGGGFSSVQLGTLIQNSKVLVNNSQFNVLNYQPWAVDKLIEVLRNSFVEPDDELKIRWEDVGTSDNHRSDYTNTGLTVKYESDGTVLENTTSTTQDYILNTSIKRDMIIDCDITPLTSGGIMRFNINGGDCYIGRYLPTVNKRYHLQFKCENNTIKLFVDGADTGYTREMKSSVIIRLMINNKSIKFSDLKISYIGMSDEEIINAVKFRLDCNELFKKEKYVPPITYYVNANSKLDLNNHGLPFMEELLKNPYFKDDFHIHFYHDHNGHNPLDNDISIELIRNFAKSNLYQDNSKFDGKSFKVNLPDNYYLKSHEAIGDSSTTIKLLELGDKDICEDIKKYIKSKKESYKRKVIIDNFNIGKATVWRVSIKNNSRYVHYWFEKYNVPFHFYASKATKEVDSVMEFLIESLRLK